MVGSEGARAEETHSLLPQPLSASAPSQSGSLRNRALWVGVGALALSCVVLLSLSPPRHSAIELEAIRSDWYKSGNARIYRKLDDLSGWKVDWAMGGDKPYTPVSRGRLDAVAQDAGRVASYLQVSEFPKDMRRAIDPSVDPCDDFYEFACGHWEESKKGIIPDDASSVALQWDVVDDGIMDTMKKLLEEDDGPAGRLYRSCVGGTRAVESWDLLTPWMDLAENVTDNATFVDAAVAVQKADMTLFWSWNVDIDTWNKERYALFIKPAHTMVPKYDYRDYVEGADETDNMRALRELVLNMVQLAGYDERTAQEDANNVLEVEAMMAIGQNNSESDADEHYEQWIDREYLTAKAPSIDWIFWMNQMNLSGVGLPDPEDISIDDMDEAGQPYSSPRLIVSQGDWLETINDIISCRDGQEDEDHCFARLQSYVRFKLIYSYAPYLDEDYTDAVHDWHSKRYGSMAPPPRWQKCYDDTTYLLGWASSYLFVEKAFPKTRKQATLEMLESIRDEFRDSLATTRWMDKKSRKAAQEKLDKMFFEVGYPEPWPEGTFRNDGQLHNHGYAKNVDIIGSNAVARATVRIFEAPKRNRWDDSYPIVVNAFYSPMVNGLWVPAGIIQRPFYSEEFDQARNYGSLGTICGHEMTHGFDDTGHLLDGNGDQKDWWDPSTFQEFDDRANCLTTQYDQYGKEVPDWYDGNHVDGENTLGENIADEGGMRFAFQAFEKSHPTERRSMAAHRLFFTAFAQNWCENDRKDMAIDSLSSDEHSPAKYRVLGVLSNFKPFANAFMCPLGSPMNPKQKCELW